MELIRTYRDAITQHRRRGGVFVILAVTAGLLEGLALATLVPLLASGGVGSSDPARYHVLGRVLEGDSLRAVALGGFVTLGILAALVRYCSERALIRFVAELEEGLRRESSSLLLRMSWSAFLTLRLGDLNASTLLVAANVANGSQYFLRAAALALVAGAFVVIALFLALDLTLFTLGFGAIAVVAYRFSGARAEAHSRQLSATAQRIGTEITDLFGNLKLFRSMGDVDRSERRTAAVYRDFAESYFRSQVYTPLMRSVFEVGATVFLGAILAISLATSGGFTPASIAFLAVFSRLTPRLLAFQEYVQLARTHRSWLSTWHEQLAVARSNQEVHRGRTLVSPPIVIEADDVAFVFPGASRPALDGVTWRLPEGGCLAFVGESGSGKTTMLDIVTGLLAPSSGELRVNGVALEELDRESWQSRLGLVLQDSPLFHGTVLENVQWASPTLDRDRALRCLGLAHAMDFVEKLPHGPETVLGESGATLSGGQRQRIALARALYRDPWLLILDEATSALDSDSEAAVHRALEEIKGQMSMLVVAHRLATVRLADHVVVLQGGRIVEEGSFTSLLARPGGAFARMAAMQDLSLEAL